MHRLAVLVLFLLGLIAVAGCTPSGGLATPRPATQDICRLLTTAEIDQYWGWPNVKAESEQGQRGPTCGYNDKDGTTAIRLNLSPVSAIPCDQLKDSANSDPIAGIGDWAYYSNDRQKLYAKKGDDCLEVVPGTGPGDPALDSTKSLTELARLAVGRL